MSNTIRLKRASGSDPGASDLVTGEVAVRTDNGKLFTKKDDNSVAEIGGGITDLVDDTSPQLGGDLQSNGNDIDFADNDKAIFGSSSDLKVYHNGTDSHIDNTTGELALRGATIRLRGNPNNNETLAVFEENGAAKLYYDNSKKLETTSAGATLTGNLTVSGTVDGRDVATDGTKLDGIESNATADQTAAEIKTLLNSNQLEAAQIAANAITAGKIPNSEITLAKITDIPQNRIVGRISSGSGVTQELTAANVRTIINVEDGATADQSASEIVALIASQTIAPTKATFPDGNSNGVVIGDGSDLKLFHNGSHSYVENVTGNLNLTSTSSINLLTNDTENSVVCNANSSVELYHNNSKCFETSAYGVKVTGGANGNSDSHSGGTVTFDFSSAAYHFVNMNANSTFAAPLNSQIGHSGSIFLTQDGTGGRTGSFNSAFKFVGGTAPTLSTAANAVDRLDFIVLDDSPLTVHIAVSLDVK